MRNLFAGILIASTLLLSGCPSPIIGGATIPSLEAEDIRDIAVCNGGASSSMGLEIAAAVEKSKMKIGGSAKLSDEIKGLFMSNPKFTGAEALTAHTQFMNCVKDRQTTRTKVSLNACRASLQCEIDKLETTCSCRKAVLSVAKENKLSKTDEAKMLGSQCYFPGNTNLKACWSPAAADLSRDRAVCSQMVVDAGYTVPTSGPCANDKG